MTSRAIPALPRNDEAIRKMKKHKLVELCSVLSDVDVIIWEGATERFFPLSYYRPYDYYAFVHKIVGERVKDFSLDEDCDEKITIETRPNSVYLFKRTIVGDYGPDYDSDHNSDEFVVSTSMDSSDYVEDTFYSIVDANDIEKFIKESGEMINGEDKIDPLDDGLFHSAEIYVIARDVIPPIGFCELVSRGAMSRNATIHLVISEGVVDEFIAKNSLRT